MRIGLVVPHIFMQDEILPKVIFSPGALAKDLANGLVDEGHEVSLFTPGPVHTQAHNVTTDLSLFEAELDARGDTYLDLLKKHPLTFVSLARQAQAELIAKAFEMANADKLDIVHIYTNEEDIGMQFSRFCQKPVVFTHHDPFNFQVKYRSLFPKYKHLNWISMSLAQRQGMPTDTNWAANIYHGLDVSEYHYNDNLTSDYVAYLGRIIEPKGVHLAIAAVQAYNRQHTEPLQLKIAGKHYASSAKDSYWQKIIEPQLQDPNIEYLGFIGDSQAKQDFVSNAAALLVPSTFSEPFGMVMLESLACGTPIIGLESGAIPEIINDQRLGVVVPQHDSEDLTVKELAKVLDKIPEFDRSFCRQTCEQRFNLQRMCAEHLAVYEQLTK